MAELPLKVASSTGPWTAAGVWTLVFVVLGGIATGIIKQLGPWRKQASDERAADFDRLREQIDRQDQKIERLEGQLATERARHEAVEAINRHKLNNIQQSFDALVLLLETAPEKVVEALSKVKAMRAEQAKTEALEKGAMRAGTGGIVE